MQGTAHRDNDKISIFIVFLFTICLMREEHFDNNNRKVAFLATTKSTKLCLLRNCTAIHKIGSWRTKTMCRNFIGTTTDLAYWRVRTPFCSSIFGKIECTAADELSLCQMNFSELAPGDGLIDRMVARWNYCYRVSLYKLHRHKVTTIVTKDT